jgi:TonB family protein
MLISRSRKVEVEGLNWKLRLHDRSGIGPFSWGGYIVMSEKDYAEGGSLIIKHESMHLQCRHWLDLIMAKCVAIVTWYNPAGWLMRQELQSVHEFEADEAVLASGVNAKEYQILLIKKAVGSRFPSIANSLDHSNLSKRIKMMLRKKSSPMQRWLAIATMPAVALSALVLMSPSVANALTKVSTTKVTADKVTNSASKEQVLANEINSAKTVKSPDNATITLDGKTIKKQELKDVSPGSIETITISNGSANEGKLIAMTTSSEANAKEDNSNNVRKMASKMPEFKGGQKAMFTYLMENVKYPEEAVEKNIQGNVIVKFVVTETGKVENATVIRGVDPLLDAEALRVISSMPDFEPGMENSKAVSVEYVLPVSFKLQGNKTEDKKLLLSAKL